MIRNGFVDIQTNGWMGTDFSEAGLTVDRVLEITAQLVERGTIAFCPTMVTGGPDVYKDNLGVIARAMQDAELGGHILGIHLEGPFISPEPGAVGAHPKKFVRKPDVKVFDQFQEWAEGNIRILTVAPEVEGCEALVSHATAQNVVVSMGHHLATDDDMARAVAAGARLCTHLGNGLPNEIHRHNNPLWWQLACDDVSALFITDGHHLPADLIQVALRAKGTARFIVTSDAAPLAGMPPGQYTIFGDLPVVIDDTGLIYSEQSKSLAGSHSTMAECMNHLAGLDLLSEDNLWQVGRENPMRLLGRDPAELDALQGPQVEWDGTQFSVHA